MIYPLCNTKDSFVFDLGLDPFELTSEELLAFLDKRIADVLTEFRRSELWTIISDPQTDIAVLRETMKEVYLEIIMYQPAVIEATIATIAQMPRTMEVSLFDEMLHHQVEEFDHGEMAMRDYVRLGGNEQYARNRRMSPSAFTCAAIWRMLCHAREPFAYLGALYPFEGLTPIVSEQIKSILYNRGFTPENSEFVEYHSTADLEHTRIVKELISTIADGYPEAKVQICYGLEYFLAVYPMPVWNAAFRRAKKLVLGN
ncbi:MAG: iron-containing redox enzyme family protein [Planctomycetales bacterium]|nr:iron-containing redox enzyme family protein [Planctomycetales bacterium]